MKLAIITGGSKGLGRELVTHYRAQNWVTVELSRTGSGEHHVAVDLSDIDVSIDAIRAKFGALAASSWDEIVFINNAGTVTPVAPVHLTDDDAIRHNLNVNFNSAIRLIATFVRAFQSSTGRKVVANISSGAAQRGIFGWSLYCASKAGMENYVSALAAEQVRSAHPFSCINISPGIIDTGMQAELRSADPSHFVDVAQFIEFKKAGQLRQPEVVALAVSRIVASEVENGKRYTVDAYV